MTPENLSRAFTVLADYGVAVNGRQITNARPVVLERLAKPDPLIDGPAPVRDEPAADAARGRLLAGARR
jgi:CRP/FNR family transcriptional activator FtrB